MSIRFDGLSWKNEALVANICIHGHRKELYPPHLRAHLANYIIPHIDNKASELYFHSDEIRITEFLITVILLGIEA